MNEGMLDEVFRPALLADVVRPLSFAVVALRGLPPGEERARVEWRAAALRVRVDPDGVLAWLDGDAARASAAGREELAARLRAEALLELARGEEAAAIVEREGRPGPEWELLRARVSIHRREHARAVELLASVMAGSEDPELRAAALGFRMRLCATLGDTAAAETDARALHELCKQHGAHATDVLFQLVGELARVPDRAALSRLVAERMSERAKQGLCEGIDDSQASLGPIPKHVHAMFVRYRNQPAAIVEAALRLCGAQHEAGQRGEAYATLHYAADIGRRLLAADEAHRLDEALDAYEALLGPDETARQREYLALRAQTFLATMRERPPS